MNRQSFAREPRARPSNGARPTAARLGGAPPTHPAQRTGRRHPPGATQSNKRFRRERGRRRETSKAPLPSAPTHPPNTGDVRARQHARPPTRLPTPPSPPDPLPTHPKLKARAHLDAADPNKVRRRRHIIAINAVRGGEDLVGPDECATTLRGVVVGGKGDGGSGGGKGGEGRGGGALWTHRQDRGDDDSSGLPKTEAVRQTHRHAQSVK